MTSPTTAAIRRETDRRLRRLGRNLGDDLTRIRLDANVSIKALGRAAGIDDAYIGRTEAGTARPSLEVLVALGVAFGADLNVRYPKLMRLPGSMQVSRTDRQRQVARREP
jgi:transcriptional regulator with XRE-family HTH domain